MGKELTGLGTCSMLDGEQSRAWIRGVPKCGERGTTRNEETDGPLGRGSIIVVVATDAPLLPHQVKRLARRATMGLARTGATSGIGSGDIFIAFSTANPGAAAARAAVNVAMLPNENLNNVFEATVQAVEEAIVNAMVGAETMKGFRGSTVYALPHDGLRDVLKKYNRLVGK